MTDFLRARNLSYFVEPTPGDDYFEFQQDPLMRNIIRSISDVFGGGVVKIYNLFNLRNQDSREALADFGRLHRHPRMMDSMEDVRFLSSPVVFGAGRSAAEVPALKDQLHGFLANVSEGKRLGIRRVGPKDFSVEPISRGNALEAYHPSYTCTRGNRTSFARLKELPRQPNGVV